MNPTQTVRTHKSYSLDKTMTMRSLSDKRDITGLPSVQTCPTVYHYHLHQQQTGIHPSDTLQMVQLLHPTPQHPKGRAKPHQILS